MKRLLLAAASTMIISSNAGAVPAQELILCRHHSRADVVIRLNDSQEFGRTLDCIHGDFIEDVTPCAPDGAYGLSAPTGAADLVGIVDRWQDYRDHTGGVTSHFLTPNEIYLASGQNSPDSGLHETWSFRVSRLTGHGELKQPGKPSVSYSCQKAKARF